MRRRGPPPAEAPPCPQCAGLDLDCDECRGTGTLALRDPFEELA